MSMPLHSWRDERLRAEAGICLSGDGLVPSVYVKGDGAAAGWMPMDDVKALASLISEVLRLAAALHAKSSQFAEDSRLKAQDFGELQRLAQALADATGERVPFMTGHLSLAAFPTPKADRERKLHDAYEWGKGYKEGFETERKEWQRRHAELIAKERERGDVAVRQLAEEREVKAWYDDVEKVDIIRTLAEAGAQRDAFEAERDAARELLAARRSDVSALVASVYRLVAQVREAKDLAGVRLAEIQRLRADREAIRARGWTDEALASRCCAAEYVATGADFLGVPGLHKRYDIKWDRPAAAENTAAIAAGWRRVAASARDAAAALGKVELFCQGGEVSVYGYDWKCGKCGACGVLAPAADSWWRVPPHAPGQKTREATS